ncbi:MAG: UDP-glucose 4-epimerase GalE [Pseudomonadales bacterium]
MVTGGAGYVGSHTCKALAQAGFLPIVLDNMIYGHEWAVKWGPCEIGDIADAGFVVEVIRKYRPIAVIHFAAFAYVGESVSQPEKYYKNNLSGTLALLEATIQSGVSRLIFSSTCATYGVPAGKTIPEDHPQRPINPYGRSKLMVEQVLRDYDSAYGFKSISLRYFNAAGADPDGELGEVHDPETHLIPLVLDAAIGRRPYITIFGTDYDTPDGTWVRDYIHVTDLADAHVRALRSLLDGAPTDAFNLGVGAGYSVRQVIDAATVISGQKIEIVEGDRRAGDPPYLIAEPGRARMLLGWQPALPELDDIIRTAWLWHKKAAGPN